MWRWIAGVCLCLAVTTGWTQNDEAARANALYQARKRPEALPLYEDLAKAHPNEKLYFERLADCLGAEASQLSDPAHVKAVRIRERDAAKRAVELGDTAEFVRQMATLDPDQPLYSGIVSPGKALLERRRKPTRREIFLGRWLSTRLRRRPIATLRGPALCRRHGLCAERSEDRGHWFARAIAIDPNRETAYRYWGDAIMKLGNDPAAAKEKFIDAIVAEPYSKFAWQGLQQWAQIEEGVVLAPKIDRPAAPVVDASKPGNININLDPNATDEKQHPGASAWLMYPMARARFRGDEFKKDFPGEKEYRHTLKEEDDALSLVVTVLKEIKMKTAELDESLRNLVEVSNAGMLDCWILISGSDDGIAKDYDAYRNGHRQLLHDYIERFVVHSGAN